MRKKQREKLSKILIYFMIFVFLIGLVQMAYIFK